MAALLLFFVVALFMAERFARGKRHFASDSGGTARSNCAGTPATGGKAAWPCWSARCRSVWALFSGGRAGAAGDHRGGSALGAAVLPYVINSLTMAGGAAVLLVAVALLLAYAKRLQGGAVVSVATQAASLGYALPGAVIAVGILIPMAALTTRSTRSCAPHSASRPGCC